MGSQNPNRRTVIKLLAGTGLLSNLAFTGSAATADDTSSVPSAMGTDIQSENVEMNEISYQLDYDIDRFDGDNISNTGAIRYERKKYADDPSFYTWQSGTWVNAADDSGDSDLAGNTYTPGSDNSRITIEERGSTEVNLNLAKVYAYTDSENNSDFPNPAFAEYAFDVAWSLMDEATPFYVPPRPPSIQQDDDSTEIDDSTDSAVISYYDPTPTMEEAEATTHSADWKWDIGGGGIDPGWNHVGANREVDNGYYQYNVNSKYTFSKEVEHQIALVSSFCIYKEDESVCETENPPSGIQTADKPCCELTTVEKPVRITDDHLNAADNRAGSDLLATERDTEREFDRQAATSYEQAPEMDTPFRELVAYRSAAAHAKGSDARDDAINGEINAQNVSQRAKQISNEINSVHNRLSYTGTTLDRALAVAAQIEKSLVSARSWVEDVSETMKLDYLSEEDQVKYGESAIEFARGNLEDAEFYLKTAANPRNDMPDQGDAIVKLYDELVTEIQNRIVDNLDRSNLHVEYAVSNAEGYLARAEDRYEDEYVAAAVLDLHYANAYLDAAQQVSVADLDNVDTAKLEVEQELTADRFNQTVDAVDADMQRFLLELARVEFNSGTETFGVYKANGDEHEAKRAYTHYLITNTVIDAAEAVAEDLIAD